MFANHHAPRLALYAALGALVFWSSGLLAIACAAVAIVGTWWAFGLAFSGDPVFAIFVIVGAWVCGFIGAAFYVFARWIGGYRPEGRAARTSGGRVEL